MVWNFCEIENSYGIPNWPNSVRFYLTVWDMAYKVVEILVENIEDSMLWNNIK